MLKDHYIRPDQNEHYIALWQQSVAGDKGAFCELVEAHYQVLFNYGTNFTTNRELIKDTLQDLFIHLWEKRETFQIQHLTIYLLRSVRNNLYLSFRDTKTKIVSIDATLHDQSDDFTIEKALIFEEAVSEEKSKVIEAISGLPKRQKEAVFLKYYQGLDNEQIAELMVVNRQSVANLLHKAILNLRLSFDKLHYFITTIFLIGL
ncbi:RNA polymerase sigma factor [Persicitalea jodogahamensis]|uniref:DNA-directed RNA polymerase sigma-70 factor n=1 Tax=Persicitalea jodogahamensis TaxID=402147 RepID=A0A8J3D6N6_9BACT|nr:sigma-70 family RNA polymerase sigma factor [Persicitalea jodogahamensis]GHB68378.1 DNA-directed RNA polymerase sigma-70 factor [Persicitalea jodogahamensis]